MRADLRRMAGALLLAAGGPAPAAEFSQAELLQAFAAVPAAQANFTEVRRSDALRAPLESRGTLHYQRPDILERRVMAPYAQVVRIAAGRVTIDDPAGGPQKSYALSALPAAQALVESLRATLAGDRAALERHYLVQFAGGRERWTLSLLPREPAAAAAITGIRLAGTAARLMRVDIEEQSGDRVTMRFSDHRP